MSTLFVNKLKAAVGSLITSNHDLKVEGDITATGTIRSDAVPAFRVGRSSNYSHTGGNYVQYDDLVGNQHYNQGGHYSTSTYLFTAPVHGVYFFHSLVIWGPSIPSGTSMADSLKFMINGANSYSYSARRANYVVNYTGTSGYFTDHITDQFLLNAGDTVGVRGQASQTVHGNDQYTYFIGHLVG